MKKSITRITILLLGLMVAFTPVQADDNSTDLNVQTLENSKESSVEIIKSSNLIVKGNQKISRESAVKVTDVWTGGHGSGTLVKIGKHYVVITAGHVVSGSPIFVIQGENGETVLGQLIYASTTADLAVIKVPRMVSRKAAKFKETKLEDFEVGDPVAYTGYPSSYELLTSVAMVSGYVEDYGAIILQGFAWPGSSGSGVFDTNGKLRGIVFAIGAEYPRGDLQLLETLVYIHPINEKDIKNIKEILNTE